METERRTIRQAMGVTLERVEVTKAGTPVDIYYIVTSPGEDAGSMHYGPAEADAAYLLALSNLGQ